MIHLCHADNCSAITVSSMFMCRKHWSMVPPTYQKAIWSNYRRGQEKDRKPSKEYLRATRYAKMIVRMIEAGNTIYEIQEKIRDVELVEGIVPIEKEENGMTDLEIKKAIRDLENRSDEDDKKAHAKYGASTAERWVNCPGSVALGAKVPKRPSGAAAKEGSLAHLCLEIFLKLHTDPTNTRKRLKKFFPKEMVEHCFKSFTHLVENTPEGAIRYSEQKVDASHFTMKDQFGTVDCAIVEEFGRLRVIDFKYGVQPVEAINNLQMIYYALGISEKFHHNFVDVEIKIIQPRAYHKEGSTRSHVISIEELLKWEKVFKLAVTEAEGKNASFKAGKWCHWCDAKAVCPEIAISKVREAGLDFDDLPDTQSSSKKEVSLFLKNEVIDLDPKEISKMLKAFPYVEMYLQAIRDHAFHHLDKGGTIPGFKLVQKEGQRKWKSEKVVAIAKKTWGPLAFTSPELLSPAQMEKVLGIEFDQKQINKWVENNVTKESSGLTLVPADDKRPATSSIEKDFASLPDVNKRSKK